MKLPSFAKGWRVSFLLVMLLSTAGGVSGFAEEKEHEGTIEGSGHPQEGSPISQKISAVPADIDSSLRENQEALATTNLLPNAEIGRQLRTKQSAIEDKLSLALQQRREKDYAQAEKNLSMLLQSDAGPEFKRTALLELALLAQEQKQFLRAQQVFSQYLQQFPGDPSTPEVLLRQGLLYRDMGAPVLALSKFYAVMSSALNLKLDKLGYYQRLVLQAQTEIADTYYLQGKFTEAADFFKRLIKLDNPELNQALVSYKLIRCYFYAGQYPQAISEGETFVARYGNASQVPEVRFLLSEALRRVRRPAEATKQVLALLQGQKDNAAKDPETWRYWQQRTGNEIANQFYQEGDYLNALEIYRHLSEIDESLEWQLPAWYQAGLIYERLRQPEKAAEMYARISERQKELGTNAPSPNLSTVLDMAKWRKEHLAWQTQAESIERALMLPAPAEPPGASAKP